MGVLTARDLRVPASWRITIVFLVVIFLGGLLVGSNPEAFYLPVLAQFAIIFLALIARRIELGLLLAVLLFVVQVSPYLPVVGYLLTISEAVLILTALVWLAQHARQQQEIKLQASGLLVPFFLYTLVAAMSLLNQFLLSDIGFGFAELFAHVYLMFLLVVIASYAATVERYRRVLLVWLASVGLVVGLVPLALIGFEPVPLTLGDKFIASFRNANALAGYAAGTMLFFIPLALSQKRVLVFRPVQTLARWVLPGLLLALIMADSQGAILALVSGLLAWPFVRLSRRIGPILVVAVLLVSILAPIAAVSFSTNPGSVLSNGLNLIGFEQSRISGRVALIRLRFETISEHPFVGIGIGQAGKYTEYVTAGADDAASHFTALAILTETGVLGLLAVLVVLMVFLGIMLENTKLDLGKESGWLQLNEGLTLAFIGMLVFGLTHDVQTSRTLWLVLALLVAFKPAFLSARTPRVEGVSAV
jgi:hypothetical protein